MGFTRLEPNSVNTSANFTFANVTAGFFIGDGGLLTNISGTGGSTYSNSNVAAYLPTYSGEFTVGNISSSGNITATYYIGNGSQLTGLPSSYSNANVSAYLPTYTGQVANAIVSGTVYGSSQSAITSLGTLTSLNVSGNISSGTYYLGNGSQLSSITGGNVTGQVANSSVAGTVYASSQPAITSLGTLTTLTVAGTSTLGAPTNLKITGGLPNYVLTTDGLGNLSWTAGGGGTGSSGGAGFITVTKDTFTATGSSNTYTLSITPSSVAYIVVNIDGIVQQVSSYSLATNVVTISGMPAAGETIEITSYGVGGLPGGSDTQIEFNDGGVFQGSPALTFNKTTSVLTLTGNITTTNANLGNLASANYISGNGSLLSGMNASNIASGTIPSSILGNSTVYVGTTSIALNRSSGSQTLTGVSIDGSAASATTATSATTAATVTATSQPNISSVGTLSSLTVSGLITATGTGIRTANVQDSTGTVTIQTKYNNLAGDVGIVGNTSIGFGGTGNLNVTGNITGTYILGNGSQLTGLPSSYANSNVTAYLPTYTGNLTPNNITMSGTTTLAETTEIIATPVSSTYDFTTGTVFYVSAPGASFTPNFTNVPTTDNRVTVISLIIAQSATPGLPTAVQIGGVAQTIKWAGGAAPSAVASAVQTVAFSLIRFGAAWTVIGAAGSYY